jgi:hypothetical protein
MNTSFAGLHGGAGTSRIVLTAQGKLTINHSLHWGTITIFAIVTGGPGNSVH